MEGEENQDAEREPISLGSEIVDDKIAQVREDEEVIRIRKEKLVRFFREKYNLVTYILLAIITFIAVRIRISNLDGLKDVTTGTWTLGPDLDPFLFLRWAKYIVENGKLMAVDMMRYSPFGLPTNEEYLLHPYMIAWFHKVAAIFGSESVTQSAVIYPVVMFALTVIAFFFLAKKIFVGSLGEKKANAIGLVSVFFLTVIPALLPRTIAGIPEKESAAFLFMFLAFYFFLSSWKAKNNKWRYLAAVLAGVSTAAMANIWGGYIFIFIAIVPTVFISFFLGKVGKRRIYAYALWILVSFFLMIVFSQRHTPRSILASTTTGSSVILLFIIVVHSLIFSTKFKKYFENEKLSKVPPKFISLVASVVILVLLSSIVFGADFVPNNLSEIRDLLIKPATSRLIQTVAENRQPYFNEWAGSFGPVINKGLPLVFWLFFFGSIYLFGNTVKGLKKKEKIILTLSYTVFLTTVIFSRYSRDSSLNGENFLSIAFYGLGFLIFFGVAGFYYYRRFNNREMDGFRKIDSGFIFLLSFFFLGIISARAAVRVIMVLVPPVSLIISYFVISTFYSAREKNGGGKKLFAWIVFGIILLATVFSGYALYQESRSTARGYIPSPYTQQWQKAMAWVRDNTPQNAVFGHWWDYGYWVQSIGERATVLDGGNSISYWNHLMGRHALTGSDNKEALEFLYAHNTTHFLIDSTDIGKYSAFSNIGSDAGYDRASFIPTILRDQNQIQEKKNSTVLIYPASVGLDEDITYEDNGTKIFLPSGNAGLGAVLIEKDSNGKIAKQPEGVFVYQGRQFVIPLRYAFQEELIDFGSGLESGVFIFPRAIQSGTQIQIDPDGALLYLSRRTVKSQFARLYLYKEGSPNFKLVHSEDDFLVSQIKSQDISFGHDFIYFQGIRGPIKIWEVDYPEDLEFKGEYNSKVYSKGLEFA